MENIVFDRNYELVSEDNSFADAVYKQITAPDGFEPYDCSSSKAAGCSAE